MFAVILGLLTACGPKDDLDTGDVYCTEIFVYSVSLSLVDEDGVPLSDAIVSYTVDGEEGSYVEHFFDGEYMVGGEESGFFEIDIYAELPVEGDDDCFRIGSATLEATIEADECHVIPQSFSPELDWDLVCLD